jgi:CSLREA domain-containing protein
MAPSTTIHSLTMRRALIALAAMAASLLMVLGTAALPAKAQSAPSGTTITVNTNVDEKNTDGDCSLREAITAANHNQSTDACPAGSDSGEDAIGFDLGSSATAITLDQTLGELGVTDSVGVVIDGAKGDVTVSGNDAVRVFFVGRGAKLALRNLTVTHGKTLDDFGGDIGILDGTLEVTNSTISHGSTGGSGGGISNSYGTLVVTDSTFSRNEAPEGSGGGIYNTDGTATVVNSTFSDNYAYFYGGGVFNDLDGPVTIINSTFHQNGADWAGSGVANYGTALTLGNTIVADSASGGNCYTLNGTPITDGGYNIEDTNTCGFDTANNSKPSTEPLLDPEGLWDNGVPTKTIALQFRSPALNYIPQDTNGCGTTITEDQRGVPRPQGTACDVGAFEIENPTDTTPPVLNLPAVLTAEATNPSGAAVDFTATANDDVDGSVAVNCSKNSGANFPLGTTTVNCSATDAAGNTATGSFEVKVQDTTAPTISNVPADISATATSSSGARVNYADPTASDSVDPSPQISCTPASGSQFPLAQSTVNCSATDAAGNSAQATFKVNITYAWSGLLQPINGGTTLNDRADDTSVFKLGSTIPVKFKLAGDSGAISDASAKISLLKLDGVPDGSELEATSTNVPDSGSTFHYDPTNAQYVFNLGTKGLTAGDYLIKIDLGDGITATNTVRFSLRK